MSSLSTKSKLPSSFHQMSLPPRLPLPALCLIPWEESPKVRSAQYSFSLQLPSHGKGSPNRVACAVARVKGLRVAGARWATPRMLGHLPRQRRLQPAPRAPPPDARSLHATTPPVRETRAPPRRCVERVCELGDGKRFASSHSPCVNNAVSDVTRQPLCVTPALCGLGTGEHVARGCKRLLVLLSRTAVAACAHGAAQRAGAHPGPSATGTTGRLVCDSHGAARCDRHSERMHLWTRA